MNNPHAERYGDKFDKGVMNMASRYKYTTKELQTKPVTEIPIEDLRSATRQLLDVANKRYSRGESSWGEDFMQTGFQPGQSVKGKSASELRKIYRQSQKFLTSKVSTEKGRKDIVNEFSKSLNLKTKLTKEEYLKITKAYARIEELSNSGILDTAGIPYKEIFEKIIKTAKEEKNLTVDDIVGDIANRTEEQYYELQERRKKEEDFNDFLLQHPELASKYAKLNSMSDDQRKLFLKGLGYNPEDFTF